MQWKLSRNADALWVCFLPCGGYSAAIPSAVRVMIRYRQRAKSPGCVPRMNRRAGNKKTGRSFASNTGGSVIAMSQILYYVLYPFGWILRTVYNLSGSYLLALFAFAIAMKLILIPFAVKQQKGMIRQAKLKPKEMAIRRKYSGRTDKATQQKIQTEIAEMYQKENYSPLSGCLPVLLQMPIIMVLYTIIRSPLTYITQLSETAITSVQSLVVKYSDTLLSGGILSKAAENSNISSITQTQLVRCLEYFQGNDPTIWNEVTNTVTDFQTKALPSFKELGGLFDFSLVPGFGDGKWILLIIPVLTFVFSYFSMKITRKFTGNAGADMNGAQGGTSTLIMDLSMPLMSVFFTFIVEAAIGVYWLFQNLLSLLQTIILAKLMPIPQVTEEDIKKAEQEMNLKSKKKTAAVPAKIALGDSAKTHARSLHFIDADEEDVPKEPQQLSGPDGESEKKPENPDSAMLGDAPELKKDDPSLSKFKKK